MVRTLNAITGTPRAYVHDFRVEADTTDVLRKVRERPRLENALAYNLLFGRHKAWVTGEQGAYYARCRCGWQTPLFEDPYECQDYAAVHRDERTRLEEQDEESRYRALEVLNDPVAFESEEAYEAWRHGKEASKDGHQ